VFLDLCRRARAPRQPKPRRIAKWCKEHKNAEEGFSVGSLVAWVLRDAPQRGSELMAKLLEQAELQLPDPAARGHGNEESDESAPGAEAIASLLLQNEEEWREHYLPVAEQGLLLVLAQRNGKQLPQRAQRLEVDVGAGLAAMCGAESLLGRKLFAKWRSRAASKGESKEQRGAAEQAATEDEGKVDAAYQAAADRVHDPRAAIVKFVRWLQQQAGKPRGADLGELLQRHALGAGEALSRKLVVAHQRTQIKVLQQQQRAKADSVAAVPRPGTSPGGALPTGRPEEIDGHAIVRKIKVFNKWAHRQEGGSDSEELIRKECKALKAEIVKQDMNPWLCAVNKYTKPIILEEVRRFERPLNLRVGGAKLRKATHFVLRGPRDTTTAFEHFAAFFAGDGRKVPTNIIDLWRQHSDKRTCHVLGFEPAEPPGTGSSSGMFNLFRGLGIPRDAAVKDTAQVQLVVWHILTIWCRGNEVHCKYLLDWMAHLVQRPGVKMIVAPVLKGGQGAGKGIIIQLLGDILGSEHFISATNLEAVTGTFQEEKVKTNLLTFLDECTFGGDKRQSSVLKGLLSENMRKWEAKFLNPIRIKNHSNFIVASNYDQVVNVEADDRRWFCLEVDNRYAGPQTDESKAYFDTLGAVDPSAFAYYLYNRDITGFTPRKIPSTAYGREQKSINFDSPTGWIEQILREGKILILEETPAYAMWENEKFLSTTEETSVSKKDVLAAYRLFTKGPDQTYNTAVGERLLIKKLKALCGAKIGKRGKRGHQVNCVIFPALSAARDFFQKNAVHEAQWEWGDLEGQGRDPTPLPPARGAQKK
jgi:hypothetical protein